jgi:hypothetical protein
MARHRSRGFVIAIAIGVSIASHLAVPAAADEGDRALSLSWDKEMLTIRGKHLPGGAVEVWYIEAYCRPGSTARDWRKTVIPHKTELLESDRDGRRIKLRSRLDDGVEVDHEIRAGRDEIDFRVVATNPTAEESQAQWAQPCIRVDRFTGTKAVRSSEDYLPRCFIYVDGKPARLPTTPWTRSALYTPGQVWCPEGVSRDDVNPRPLSPIVPSNGLIGCVSVDGNELLATAWEPYQELFQGVIVCLHSDFRIGGLKPGQSKTIRGKIYLMPAGFAELEARYRKDFPEHLRRAAPTKAGASAKKLIEFGWDEPGTGFLRSHRAELEATPFDGCVFHAEARPARGAPVSFTWLGWGRRRFTPEELKAARDDLESIGETRFRHNFLRFNTTPADLDWFDDHAAVVENARLAAQLARAGRCEGILLDTEQYEGKLFDYAQQRDVKRRTWDDYAAEARRRGREVMTAFQEGYPDLTVFLTFGHSLLWKQGERGKKPLAECRYGLLVPFLDGMIDAARGRTRIVDGHEMSYGYRDADAFATAYRSIKQDAEALAADRDAYRRVVSAGFGLWLDYDWRKTGWDMADLEKNYFSPERFEISLRAAIDQSDEFVWIYTEKPRWWSGSGKAVDLPSAYIETVERVRRAPAGR